MRGYFTSTIATSTIATTAIAIAAVVSCVSPVRSDEVLRLDVRPVCRGIAAQSADPGVGQGAQAETFQRCLDSEQQVLEDLKKAWPNFSAADKRHCVDLAKTGGESSYTELLTCLEMSRDVRQMRAAAAGNAAAETTKAETTKAETTKPQSPPSTPAAPAAAPEPAAKEPPKTPAGAATTEVDKAKAEAQAAKASQALAEKKLADAEAALARASEDAKRAATEAEQAKAATQAAKESEAAVKRKLADVEAARAAAEKACSGAQPRPGLVGRVRGWLRRPANKNP